MRVLVTASRTWDDRAAISHALCRIHNREPGPHTLVHGACPKGGDLIAAAIASDLGWFVEPHPADWDRYGRAAGPRRNAEMVALGADCCLAFIQDGSKGATGCADIAESAGIETYRWLWAKPDGHVGCSSPPTRRMWSERHG